MGFGVWVCLGVVECLIGVGVSWRSVLTRVGLLDYYILVVFYWDRIRPDLI